MAEEVETVWKTCCFRSARVRRCGFESISSLPMTGSFYRAQRPEAAGQNGASRFARAVFSAGCRGSGTSRGCNHRSGPPRSGGILRVRACCSLLGLLLLPSAASAGELWALGGCTEADDARSRQVAQEVLAASPTSELHVPHPFPEIVGEALADFEHQYVRSWSKQPRRLVPADDRWMLELLESDALAAEWLTGANWTPSRCGLVHGTQPAFHLLRLKLRADGGEVARVVLLPSGLLHSLRLRRDQRSFAMMDGHHVEDMTAAQRAATERGLNFERPQYVALAGPTMPCSEANPCIAFRDGERAFLFRSGKVFELSHRTERFSVREFARDSPERRRAESLLTAERHFVSLGGDDMTLATELPTTSARP